MGAIKVEGRTPWSLETVCKVRAEKRKVIPLGSKMVINNIQNHSYSDVMGCIHQALQACRPAIRILDRKKPHTIVPPVPAAGKLADRHEFNCRYTKRLQICQMRNHPIECPV